MVSNWTIARALASADSFSLHITCLALTRWLSGKEFFCQCRRCRFHPWVRKIPLRWAQQLTPVFLPGKSHGQRTVEGYRPWGHKRVGHDLATQQQPQPAAQWKGIVWFSDLGCWVLCPCCGRSNSAVGSVNRKLIAVTVTSMWGPGRKYRNECKDGFCPKGGCFSCWWLGPGGLPNQTAVESPV